LVCDPSESGRLLFQEFTSCRLIFNSATDLLNLIRASGDTSVIHGYLIHSPSFQTSETTTTFWQIQATIISQLRLIRSLSIIIAMIHPDHDGRSVKTFSSNLKSNGWVLSSTDVFSFIRTWVILLLVLVVSSLLSIHPAPQRLIHYS
jgi:hypothetical protein